METATANSMLVSLLCVLAIAGLVKVVNWIWLRPKKLEKLLRQQGIPGTSYRPLFGDLKDVASLRAQAMTKPMSSFFHDSLARIDPFRHQLMTKFGKVFFMWSGPKPTIVISKPELLREALPKIQEFQKPKTNPIVGKLFAGLVNYEGEQWAQHQRMLNPAFQTKKLKLMLPAFCVSCDERINKLEELVAEAGHGEVDVWPHLNMLSADVISRAAFGSNYEEGQKIFQLLREQLLLALSMLQSVYIPGSRYIPTVRNRRFNRINDEIDTLLKRIIDKRKKAMEAGEAPKDDLLGILMDSNMKEIKQAAASGSKNQRHGISLEEVIEECKLFYFAGQETTSILLVWTLILLSTHRDWQARAREEVLQTFGSNAPSFEGLNYLKTVNMILYEVLRMYPPAPLVPRMVFKDTKLGELSLPAGEKFAMTEAKIALSMILQRFSWELSPSCIHSPITVVTLKPQHGAEIILHRLR
ncbi:hypothetical protein Cgig2_006225 [Carnegiea gigantea]|uniref:Cytochrome P450 n=1 Tax=Carnegiea gigantea TaxID=171969 RepID=A0A9Q1KYV4_9CARY|nr:hypothetical protein Cgig2_006225 [Carnegiea gigantea]